MTLESASWVRKGQTPSKVKLFNANTVTDVRAYLSWRLNIFAMNPSIWRYIALKIKTEKLVYMKLFRRLQRRCRLQT